MQEAERIEYRMRRLPKRLEQGRERRFRGARSLGVAAHAVDDGKQHRIVVGGNPRHGLDFLRGGRSGSHPRSRSAIAAPEASARLEYDFLSNLADYAANPP
jgi:hypothetical protein